MARKTQTRTVKARKQTPAPSESVLHRAAQSCGDAIAKNPAMVGGTTAFLIALSFVAANAMWYQPHFHKGAFFTTRDLPDSTLPLEAPVSAVDSDGNVVAAAAEPKDPIVHKVQVILQDLKLYKGPLDGSLGQETADAIITYQRILGQPTTGEVDEALLAQLGIQTGRTSETATASINPAPAPSQLGGTPERLTPAATGGSGLSDDERVRRIQTGLRAFGNDSVEVDGKVGAKTRSAIREFQSLFGMEANGEPDEVLYARMREIGLTR